MLLEIIVPRRVAWGGRRSRAVPAVALALLISCGCPSESLKVSEAPRRVQPDSAPGADIPPSMLRRPQQKLSREVTIASLGDGVQLEAGGFVSNLVALAWLDDDSAVAISDDKRVLDLQFSTRNSSSGLVWRSREIGSIDDGTERNGTLKAISASPNRSMFAIGTVDGNLVVGSMAEPANSRIVWRPERPEDDLLYLCAWRTPTGVLFARASGGVYQYDLVSATVTSLRDERIARYATVDSDVSVMLLPWAEGSPAELLRSTGGAIWTHSAPANSHGRYYGAVSTGGEFVVMGRYGGKLSVFDVFRNAERTFESANETQLCGALGFIPKSSACVVAWDWGLEVVDVRTLKSLATHRFSAAANLSDFPGSVMQISNHGVVSIFKPDVSFYSISMN